jgi:CBS domain-containing protein
MHARVTDVMTRDVKTVTPATGFKDLIATLSGHRVSALPVVDAEGLPVGVVSDGDLLLKQGRTDEATRRPGRLGPTARAEASKAGGVIAAQLMSTPPVTISADATLPEAARLMHSRKVKRLLVTDGGGRLIGIVSRADLLSVFAREDEEIRREVVEELIEGTLWLEEPRLNVSVRDGVVWIRGDVDRRSEAVLLERLAAAMDGVVTVRADIAYRLDDISRRPSKSTLQNEER